MSETELLERITLNPNIFGGKPIVRGRRLAVEHVLGMMLVQPPWHSKAAPASTWRPHLMP